MEFAGGRGVPPLTLWNKPEVDGYTRSVRVGTPEAHVRLPLGHRDSTQNEVHTEAGPNRLIIIKPGKSSSPKKPLENGSPTKYLFVELFQLNMMDISKLCSLENIRGLKTKYSSPLHTHGISDPSLLLCLDDVPPIKISPIKQGNVSLFTTLQRYKAIIKKIKIANLIECEKSNEAKSGVSKNDIFLKYISMITCDEPMMDLSSINDSQDLALLKMTRDDKILLGYQPADYSSSKLNTSGASAQIKITPPKLSLRFSKISTPITQSGLENKTPNVLNSLSSPISYIGKNQRQSYIQSAKKSGRAFATDGLESLMSTCTDVLSEIDSLMSKGLGSSKKLRMSSLAVTPSKLPRRSLSSANHNSFNISSSNEDPFL